MKQRALLAPILGLLLLATTPAAWTRAVTQTDGVVSGGIGLSRADWEERHGPGEVGQNYVTYEGGAYYVQFRDDVVSFLEFGWADPGVTFGEAEAAVLDFLPSDARLDETFYAPATAGGPTALLMHRYASRALAAGLPDVDQPATGGILVVYQETPAPDRFEPNVTRVSIASGSAQ